MCWFMPRPFVWIPTSHLLFWFRSRNRLFRETGRSPDDCDQPGHNTCFQTLIITFPWILRGARRYSHASLYSSILKILSTFGWIWPEARAS